MDSCFAESMNAHVLTTMTSASAGVRGQFVARLVREAEHHLGIHEILRAAERNQAYLHVTGPRSSRSLSSIRLSSR